MHHFGLGGMISAWHGECSAQPLCPHKWIRIASRVCHLRHTPTPHPRPSPSPPGPLHPWAACGPITLMRVLRGTRVVGASSHSSKRTPSPTPLLIARPLPLTPGSVCGGSGVACGRCKASGFWWLGWGRGAAHESRSPATTRVLCRGRRGLWPAHTGCWGSVRAMWEPRTRWCGEVCVCSFLCIGAGLLCMCETGAQLARLGVPSIGAAQDGGRNPSQIP